MMGNKPNATFLIYILPALLKKRRGPNAPDGDKPQANDLFRICCQSYRVQLVPNNELMSSIQSQITEYAAATHHKTKGNNPYSPWTPTAVKLR